MNVAAAAPILFAASLPTVGAGQTLMIPGTGLSDASLHVCRADSGCVDLPNIAVAYEGSITATLPSTPAAPAVLTVSACSRASGACSAPITVNAPEVSFVHLDTDADGQAHAGSTLRVVGRALAWSAASGRCEPLLSPTEPQAWQAVADAATALRSVAEALETPLPRPVVDSFSSAAAAALAGVRGTTDGSATLALRPVAGGADVPLAPSLVSCFRIDAPLPAGTQPGSYALILNSGLLPAPVAVANFTVVGGRGPSTGWPALTFALGVNCSTVDDCLSSARGAGGGIVRLPAGRFAMAANAVLNVSGRVQLLGAGANATYLEWRDNVAPPPPALVICEGFGRIIGVAIVGASPAAEGLRFSEGSVGCALDNAAITLDVGPSVPLGTAFAAYGSAHWGVVGATLTMRGNCSAESWPHNTAFVVERCRDALMGSLTVVCGCQGHSTDSSSRILYDMLAVVSVGADSQGTGASTFQSPNVLQGLYTGRSVDIGNPAATKRWESLTLDGPGGAAFSYVDSSAVGDFDGDGSAAALAANQTLVLANPPSVPDKYLPAAGLAAIVMDGAGAGMWTRAVAASADARTWTLSPPFAAPLAPAGAADASLVAIVPFRGDLFWEGCAYLNDTTHQLFGTALGVVSAGNYVQNMTGTMTTWGLWYDDGQAANAGFQPNYQVLYDANTIRCSGGLGSLSIPGPQSPINFTAAFNRQTTYRRGAMLAGANVKLDGATSDVLVEGVAFAADICLPGGAQRPAGSYSAASSTSRIIVLP